MTIYTHYKYFSYSHISVCAYGFLCCLPSFMSSAEIGNICSLQSKNNRITEYFVLEGTHKGHCRKYSFFPPGNKLASRICLNFLFKHAGDRMGIKWLCALWSYRKSFVQPHLVYLSVRHRLTPLTRFGIRENFLPSELGREKEPWDI